MTKVVGSITRGQSHEILNQIEDAMKASKVDPFLIAKKMLSKKTFKKLITDYLKENGQAVVSEKFDTTEFVVSTSPSGNTYNIKKDIAKLLPTKTEGGLFDYRDGDITGWFGDATFTDTEVVSGRVQLFKNNMKHREIIAEGENLGIYEEYELGHALLLANELVKAGAIEKKGYGVVIYLKNRKNDNRCRLFVYRHGDGDLEVRISRVDPGREWGAGDGVLFSN